MSPNEAWPHMRVAVEKALQLGPRSADAHAQAATMLLFQDWQLDAAVREFDAALAIDSANVSAATWYRAALELMRDKAELAVRVRERGVQLNPGSPSILSHAIAVSALQPLSETKRGERCSAATAIDPKLGTRCESGRALLAGDRVRALTLLRQSTSAIDANASGRDHASLAQLLLAYGDTAGARREVAIAVEKSAHEYVREDYFARVYFRLGDIEQSIEWWRRAVALRSSQVS